MQQHLYGIKAMESMQEENKDKKTLTNEMATFIVLNTASIQIIPTTVIAIRNSLGSSNPTAIIVPVWICLLYTSDAADD
mgnify:CR=1 FL=1